MYHNVLECLPAQYRHYVHHRTLHHRHTALCRCESAGKAIPEKALNNHRQKNAADPVFMVLQHF